MQALQATAQRYSAEEIALRAVPALAPLSVDPIAQVTHWTHSSLQATSLSCTICLPCVESARDNWACVQVRQNSLSALQSYMQILGENATALDRAAAAAAENGDASAAASQQV